MPAQPKGGQDRQGNGSSFHRQGNGSSFQSVYAEVFCHPTEDLQRVLAAFRTVCGNMEAKREKVPSHYGPEIVKLTLSSTRPVDIKRVVEAVRALRLHDIGERVDDAGYFFARFDKQAAFRGTLAESGGGDVVKVKLKVAVYPFNAEKAREKARECLLG
ncbi:hypothetical protein HYS54_03660 [Candidatus Micrarchaeota archaeon]|nr:hypothetical protein [Candidatus Micrarchaeota archaeon]